MIRKNGNPILEFDEELKAKINPETFVESTLNSNKLIITFFKEVITKLISEGELLLERVIRGENEIIIYRFKDSDVLLIHGYVGASACGGNLDLLNAMGIKKVMFCGGGGVLDKNIEVGTLLLVEDAIRDEGFSYHYLAPSRIVKANTNLNDKIASYLDKNSIPYIRGTVWTTDAIFRETPSKIELRKKEGAKIVEMEQAGCLAVANVRKFDYAALIYGGDDVSSKKWSNRDWRSRDGIRYNLVKLCKELIEIM